MGAVRDLLFDDQHWTVRYLVADTRTWLPGRKVLLSPVSVQRADWTAKTMQLQLTQGQIRESPGIETDRPVSRQYEERLVAYYGWPGYWAASAPSAAAADDEEPLMYSKQGDIARAGDAHLRSLREVRGYHMSARDGEIGHIDDFIGDDTDWRIRYLVIDTRNWLPGKRVLVAPHWVDQVNWRRAHVAMDLDCDQIRGAPPYEPGMPINRAYEEQLHEYYGQPACRDDEK